MTLNKKIHIRVILKEGHAGSKIYYDRDLGILRQKKQSSPAKYVASPAIMLRKNKKALRKTHPRAASTEKCNA